jgi:hypothetical protein
MGKLDRADARLKRQIARGAAPETLRADRKARKAAWKKELADWWQREATKDNVK